MLIEESYWIKQKLETISDIKNAVDIGASTLEFRTIKQPYIEKNIYQPLIKRGIKITQLDAKKEDGVDIVCNISDIKFTFPQQFDLAICTNLLEHVVCLDSTINNISNLVNDGSYLIVTVPSIYPYHPDPIDTMSRFSIHDLKFLFKNFNIISAEIIDVESKTFFNRFLIGMYSVVCILRDMRLGYFSDNIKYHFLKKPKVTCIIFKKISKPSI